MSLPLDSACTPIYLQIFLVQGYTLFPEIVLHIHASLEFLPPRLCCNKGVHPMFCCSSLYCTPQVSGCIWSSHSISVTIARVYHYWQGFPGRGICVQDLYHEVLFRSTPNEERERKQNWLEEKWSYYYSPNKGFCFRPKTLELR